MKLPIEELPEDLICDPDEFNPMMRNTLINLFEKIEKLAIALHCSEDNGHEWAFSTRKPINLLEGEFPRKKRAKTSARYYYVYECPVCCMRRCFTWEELSIERQEALTLLGLGESK